MTTDKPIDVAIIGGGPAQAMLPPFMLRVPT